MVRWACVATVMVGCVETETLERLESGQKRIESKLDSLIKQRPTQRTARARDPGPDPKKTYRFPVDDAHCIFRRKPITDSDRCRSPNPMEADRA